jgi:hypothetical protein
MATIKVRAPGTNHVKNFGEDFIIVFLKAEMFMIIEKVCDD